MEHVVSPQCNDLKKQTNKNKEQLRDWLKIIIKLYVSELLPYTPFLKVCNCQYFSTEGSTTNNNNTKAFGHSCASSHWLKYYVHNIGPKLYNDLRKAKETRRLFCLYEIIVKYKELKVFIRVFKVQL